MQDRKRFSVDDHNKEERRCLRYLWQYQIHELLRCICFVKRPGNLKREGQESCAWAPNCPLYACSEFSAAGAPVHGVPWSDQLHTASTQSYTFRLLLTAA